jgi:hypothetical protein
LSFRMESVDSGIAAILLFPLEAIHSYGNSCL